MGVGESGWVIIITEKEKVGRVRRLYPRKDVVDVVEARGCVRCR